MNKRISGYLWAWTGIETGTIALKQLKKFHPDADIFINVDYNGSYDEYVEIGKQFDAVVTRNNFQVGYCGDFGDIKVGKPHWSKEESFEFIRGLYEACKKSDSKYMILLEEDNFLLKSLSMLNTEFSMLVHASMPSAAGNHRPNYLPPQFLEFSKNLGGVGNAPGYGAGGGCIFNREHFIKSWDIAKEPLWDAYDDLAKINKIIGWEDFIVQFVMMIGGYEIDQLYVAAQPWEQPNWRTAKNYKGNDYEMICGLKDIEEIRNL
jgi:hypothetical protein